MKRTAIIAAAGWHGAGRLDGLVDCPEPFLPLGDGTTALSRAAEELAEIDFDIIIGVGKLGYPIGEYMARNARPGREVMLEELEELGVSLDHSPWTAERLDYAAQLGTVIEIPNPGWGNSPDTFCILMDALDSWEQLLLVEGDMVVPKGLLTDIVALECPCQYQLHPNHAYFFFDKEAAAFYREYVEPMRMAVRKIDGEYSRTRSEMMPSGHPRGTGKLMDAGIAKRGPHNGPGAWCRWVDIDNPRSYALAKKMVGDGTIDVALAPHAPIYPELDAVIEEKLREQEHRLPAMPKAPPPVKGPLHVVVMMMTWSGPAERGLADIRLGYMQKAIDSLHKHLKYPSWSWHVADDGSSEEYQQKAIAILGKDKYTFSDTRANGDIGLNLNVGGEGAYAQSPVVVFWQDDRWLVRDLDLEPCVTLLMEDEDICLIRLKPQQPRMMGTAFTRHGCKWWAIDKSSRCSHVCTLGPNIRHRRFLETYGEYSTGIPTDILEHIMNRHFRSTTGPGVVCPDSRWGAVEMPWGKKSTWE